jgi:hypothetical protein
MNSDIYSSKIEARIAHMDRICEPNLAGPLKKPGFYSSPLKSDPTRHPGKDGAKPQTFPI